MPKSHSAAENGYPPRLCPACHKPIGHGLAYYNHVNAHVRRGELVERTINGKKVYMMPGEVQKVEGGLF